MQRMNKCMLFVLFLVYFKPVLSYSIRVSSNVVADLIIDFTYHLNSNGIRNPETVEYGDVLILLFIYTTTTTQLINYL